MRSRRARAGDNYQPLAVIKVEHLNTAGMHTGSASKFVAQLLDARALARKIKSLRHPSLVDASQANYQPLAVIRVEHLNTAGMHTGRASKFCAQLLDALALADKIKSLRHPCLVDASPSHL